MYVSMPVIIPRVSKDNVVTFRKKCPTIIKDKQDKTGELIWAAASLCAVTARLGDLPNCVSAVNSGLPPARRFFLFSVSYYLAILFGSDPW